jgi:hypothetical protein
MYLLHKTINTGPLRQRHRLSNGLGSAAHPCMECLYVCLCCLHNLRVLAHHPTGQQQHIGYRGFIRILSSGTVHTVLSLQDTHYVGHAIHLWVAVHHPAGPSWLAAAVIIASKGSCGKHNSTMKGESTPSMWHAVYAGSANYLLRGDLECH